MKAEVTPISGQKEVTIKPFPRNVWEEMERMVKQIHERAFQLFEWRGRKDGHDLEDWLKAESEFLKWVPIEVTEKDNSLKITADVPGFQANELEIGLEGNTLTIKGKQEKETEKKEEKTYFSEKQAKQIFRSITLPSAVDPGKAVANLKDGVLEITAPKTEPAKRIEVKAA